MKSNHSPDRKTLEELLLGNLPAEQRKEFEERLVNCGDDTAAADTITASDEFTDAARAEPALDSNDETILAIEDGRRVKSLVGTMGADETVTYDGPVSAGSSKTSNESSIGFLTPPERPDEIGRLGGYRVFEVLGIGGMGIVFRAEDPQLERMVALKVMKPSLGASKANAERFLREARAAAAIDHDHIVHIYQVGEDRGIPFTAMQFLRGETLQTRLDREGRINQPDLLRIGREIASGLDAAHARNLVHRDIKPDNIWLEAGTARVKLVDFGLVRGIDEDQGLTLTGTVLGTPKYMAPEQAMGAAVDHRADLFSLGSVLYHMAASEPPFHGQSLTEVLLAVTQADPQPVDQLRPDIDAELVQLIMHLLAKAPHQRLQSAAEVVQAIENIEQRLANESSPRRIPAGKIASQGTATPGRHVTPVLVAGGAIVAALGTLGALWATGQFGLSRRTDGIDFAAVESPSGSAVGPAPAIRPIEIRRFELRHLRRVGNSDVPTGAIGEHAYAAHLGDGVKVSAELSEPAYCFLLACRPDGVIDVCFPESDSEPPPLTAHPRYPSESARYSYGLEEGTGLEAFFLVVSRNPLPCWRDWQSQLPASPWRHAEAPPGIVWRYRQGQLLDYSEEYPQTRGKAREVLGGGLVAATAEEWLLRAPGIEAVEGIGFVVQPAQ